MSNDAQLLADFLSLPRPVSVAPVPTGAPTSAEDQPLRPLTAMLHEQHRAQPDRMPWPDAWFGRPDPADAAACRRLWATALLACIRDAVTQLSVYEKRRYGGDAVRGSWIGSRDFHMMASLAGFDGMALADRLMRIDDDPAMRDRILKATDPSMQSRNPTVTDKRERRARDV